MWTGVLGVEDGVAEAGWVAGVGVVLGDAPRDRVGEGVPVAVEEPVEVSVPVALPVVLGVRDGVDVMEGEAP